MGLIKSCLLRINLFLVNTFLSPETHTRRDAPLRMPAPSLSRRGHSFLKPVAKGQDENGQDELKRLHDTLAIERAALKGLPTR